jgi:hypothetical protein
VEEAFFTLARDVKTRVIDAAAGAAESAPGAEQKGIQVGGANQQGSAQSGCCA